MDSRAILQEIFPGKSVSQINEIIQMVEEQTIMYESEEHKIENMINLLMESGDSTLYHPPVEEENDPEDEDFEGAVGYGHQLSNTEVNRYYDELLNYFPDMDPNYLLEYLRTHRKMNFDEIIDNISTSDYMKREKDPITIAEQLKQMLPNADPSYLHKKAKELALKPDEELNEFIEKSIENNDYPTMKEYLVRKQEKDKRVIYTEKFTVDSFLEAIPDPVEKFENPEEEVQTLSEDEDIKYALNFLYNKYRFIRKKYIDTVFHHNRTNLIDCCHRLNTLPRSFRTMRNIERCSDSQNIALLQQVAFLRHEKEIRRVLKQRDRRYKEAKEQARLAGLLETCQCCYVEELIPEECYFCMDGCVFCKECVVKGTEVVIGKGETKFPCFIGDSYFSLWTLKMTLNRKTFDRLEQRILSDEIKYANLDGLETCPFCDFAVLLPDTVRIFKCENEDCGKESCRDCRHESHIPLRCSEIEYDEDVKRRTYIENKMTEALVRTCPTCKKTFLKENGCNKMTCVCGTKMCYICGITVNDYSHFSQTGCPLYTENLNQLHLDRVRRGVQSAKTELGNVEIKFDPSENLDQFF